MSGRESISYGLLQLHGRHIFTTPKITLPRNGNGGGTTCGGDSARCGDRGIQLNAHIIEIASSEYTAPSARHNAVNQFEAQRNQLFEQRVYAHRKNITTVQLFVRCVQMVMRLMGINCSAPALLDRTVITEFAS
jgi:hypothetical protein